MVSGPRSLMDHVPALLLPGEAVMNRGAVEALGRDVIEALRQPIEEGKISVSRASHSITYPAKFLMVASMNPCPCGNHQNPQKECLCTPGMILRYQKKISGPILDRFDIKITVPQEDPKKLKDEPDYEESRKLRSEVEKAKLRQAERFEGAGILTNSEMSNRQVRKFCKIDSESQEFLDNYVTDKKLSHRSYFKILKLARTIADLEGQENISLDNLREAGQYKNDGVISL